MIWTIEFAAPNIGNANLHAGQFGLTAIQGGRLGYQASGSLEAVTALRDDLSSSTEREACKRAEAAARQAYADSVRDDAALRAYHDAIAAAQEACEKAIRQNYFLTRGS